MSTFGDNIAKLRENRGMSQRDLASKLGISKGSIGAWETKDTLPDGERMEQLSEFFELPMNELFSEDLFVDDTKVTCLSMVEVPLFGSIAAGTPIEMLDIDEKFPIPEKLLDCHSGPRI